MRDLAIMVLIDVSESTRDRVPAAEARIIDIEKHAVAVLAEAMDGLGDSFALRAFSSNGREEVRFMRVKDLHNPSITPPGRGSADCSRNCRRGSAQPCAMRAASSVR